MPPVHPVRTHVRGAYDVSVDPTTQAALAALVGAIVAGGAVLAWHISDRQRHTAPAGGAARRPGGRRGRPEHPALQRRRGRRVRPRPQGLGAGVRLRAGARQHRPAARAARPHRAGATRRADPRERHRHARARRRVHPHADRAGGAARSPAGAGARRGPHPRAPRRGSAPRLRGQRQPRAQDPGRRDPPACRGRHRRGRRPGGRAALRRADAHRERPALQARAADHRAVPAAGPRPARAARHGRPRRRGRDRRRHQRHGGGRQADHRRVPRRAGPGGLRVPGADRRRDQQPRRQRGRLLQRGLARGRHDQVRGHPRPDLGGRPGHRHPGRRHRPHLRALLPRRPRAPPLDGRHRPRPLDRQARRGHPRRRHRRVVGAGTGLDLHPHASPRTRSPARAPAAPPRSRSSPPCGPPPAPIPDHAEHSRRPTDDPRTRRRGRRELQRRPRLHAPQGGLRGGDRRRRQHRPHGVRPLRARHRPARPDAPRASPARRSAGRSARRRRSR